MDQHVDKPILEGSPSGSLGFSVDQGAIEDTGRKYYNLGKIHYDKADLVLAEENFMRAYECASRPQDLLDTLKILGFLIRIASERLEDSKANDFISKADSLMGALTALPAHANAEYFYNAGMIHTYKGNFEQAQEKYQLAYQQSKEEDRIDVLSKTLLCLAVNSYRMGNPKQSLVQLDQLSELLHAMSRDYLAGAMHFYRAKVLTELEAYGKALTYYRLSNETLQDKKCWNLFGYILLGKGIVYKRNGHYEKALDLFQLGLESTDGSVFCRLYDLIHAEIRDVNDSSVDIYLDRDNRKIRERYLGVVDFKHRFVLLEILFLLASNPGIPYDKQKLAEAVWKDDYNPLMHDKLIYTSVSRLRKLIDPKGGAQRKYILRGRDGYTFNPEVKIRFHKEEQRRSGPGSIGNVDLGSPV